MAKKKHKKVKAKAKSKARSAATPAAKAPIMPIGDRVLVKREDVDITSPSGIIIPDTAKTEKSKRGLIIAVGSGRVSEEGKVIPPHVKPGQKVFFNSGWDNEVKMGSDDEEYFLVKESDILAIIN